MIQKGVQSLITEQRVNAIARRILQKGILEIYNSKLEVIKKIDLDSTLCVQYFIDELKKQYPHQILLSEVDYYIQQDESVEQLAEDLNITISELSDFKMYLYNKYSEK